MDASTDIHDYNKLTSKNLKNRGFYKYPEVGIDFFDEKIVENTISEKRFAFLKRKSENSTIKPSNSSKSHQSYKIDKDIDNTSLPPIQSPIKFGLFRQNTQKGRLYLCINVINYAAISISMSCTPNPLPPNPLPPNLYPLSLTP